MEAAVHLDGHDHRPLHGRDSLPQPCFGPRATKGTTSRARGSGLEQQASVARHVPGRGPLRSSAPTARLWCVVSSERVRSNATTRTPGVTEAIVDRFYYLEEKLSDPETLSDMKLFAKVNKEYKYFETIVEVIQKYKTLVQNIDGSRQLLTDSNHAIRARAK